MVGFAHFPSLIPHVNICYPFYLVYGWYNSRSHVRSPEGDLPVEWGCKFDTFYFVLTVINTTTFLFLFLFHTCFYHFVFDDFSSEFQEWSEKLSIDKLFSTLSKRMPQFYKQGEQQDVGEAFTKLLIILIAEMTMGLGKLLFLVCTLSFLFSHTCFIFIPFTMLFQVRKPSRLPTDCSGSLLASIKYAPSVGWFDDLLTLSRFFDIFATR